MTNLRLPGQYDERLFAQAGISGLQGPYYNWNRWYLPSMGRYLELDPIALRGGFNGRYGPEWYAYALANPMRWVDSTGLEYNDLGLSFGVGGLSMTVGWVWGHQGFTGYYGFGVGNPGFGISFTGSADDITPGRGTSLQLGFGGAFQTGLSPDGSRYYEYGAGTPGFGWYPFYWILPLPPPPRPEPKPMPCH